MIESIHIKDIATYDNNSEYFNNLSKFNFIYGSNGSGKTTITRVIAAEEKFPTCNVIWKGGTKLETMVYNGDFVVRNFSSSIELKGIFTLGEKNAAVLNSLAGAKKELDELTNEINTLNITLHGQDATGGKAGELRILEEQCKNKCWVQKQKHDSNLSGAFEGYRNSAEKFKLKILQEWMSNSAILETLEDLEKKAKTVFGPTSTIEQTIPSIDTEKVVFHEANTILKKRVIGKTDVDISAMIKKLGNSDWVKEGRTFYEINETLCPFCQQNTIEAFAKSLNEYFDETFITDSKSIDDLISNYTTDSVRLQQQIASIIATGSKFLDIEKLKTEKELLDSKITLNIQKLTLKKKEPSQIIELESIHNVISAIANLIVAANLLITDHNHLISNLAQERLDLTAQVWKYILEVELKIDIETYNTTKNSLNKAITGITEKIKSAETNKRTKIAQIRTLEKETTSIQPTIDGINTLLSSFGFQSFLLAKADNGTCYKLIRKDGADAKETLSEGERSFITFLYFYYLLKGSDSDAGMTTDRVVVFDDPVSSLDSDILFIVGSLIKELFDEIKTGTSYIKQLFVFTHNVYFHKEITFNKKRKKAAAFSDETFWIVRKTDSISKLKKYDSNPIKTSYELLWAEVRNLDRSNLTIQNTLRRVLENYFKILGGVDTDAILEMFIDGKEKLICKSLFSWVNDGSHFAQDDLYVSIDDSMVDTYINVFRAIFEKSGHGKHYEMMMGNSYVEISVKDASL